MTNNLLKVLFILLVMVLLCRPYIGWVKNSPKKVIPILTGVFALAISPIMVIFLTLFEILFCLSVVVLLFIFRKYISNFMKKILSKKFGKLLTIGSVFLFVFVLWFGLAVFYRTDIGMPIGVQNYLFHKYHEEFDVNGFFGATIAGHPTNQLTCCPKNGNPATDAFNVVRKNTLSIGSRRFASDNYYGIIIREDYEKYVSDIVSKYFDEFKVFVRFEFSGLSNTKYMSDEFDKNTSLEDFFNYQKNSDNIRACNTANLSIMLEHQPLIKEQNVVIEKTEQIFTEFSEDLKFTQMSIITIVEPERCKYYDVDRIYYYNILNDNKSGEYISSIYSFITDDNNYYEMEISDDFFRNE